MERLTKRNEVGYGVVGDVTIENGISRTILTPHEASKIQEALNRLAAYEETGLEPERVTELAQAEKDGRLVIYHFKPGECVWALERDEDGEAIDVAGCMFLAEVLGYVIASAFINDMEDAEETLSYHAEETKDNYDTDLMVYPIEDVYQTKQEAEEALREEAENG